MTFDEVQVKILKTMELHEQIGKSALFCICFNSKEFILLISIDTF